jgi:TfoX/Sxy family transcriptional regulator of competence genes
MAYDELLAQRIRESVAQIPGFSEKKMFGGVGYMLKGNMACGVNGSDLIVRVGPDQYEEVLALPVTKPFDMTGRPMKGWITVSDRDLLDDSDLEHWVRRGVEFALTLPPK